MFTFAVYLGWYWAMGSFLHFLVRPPLRLSFAFFRFALAFPVVYGFAFTFVALLPQFNFFYVILPPLRLPIRRQKSGLA